MSEHPVLLAMVAVAAAVADLVILIIKLLCRETHILSLLGIMGMVQQQDKIVIFAQLL